MKMRRKSDLPSKICPSCGRPFTWRKKWERCWEDVRYCSDRCRRARSTKAACSVNGEPGIHFTRS